MDPYPKNFPTKRGGGWKRRPDLEGTGIAYEYIPGGAIGWATGRLSASIPAATAREAIAWLTERELRTRIVHEGPEVAVIIESDDALRPLKMFEEISSVSGLESVQPEILMDKSKK